MTTTSPTVNADRDHVAGPPVTTIATTRSPTLVITLGISASGKTSAAKRVRRRYGRGCALIELDYLRRVVLREHGSDSPTVAPCVVVTVARATLEHGCHVALEGILQTRPCRVPLQRLIAEHPGPRSVYWLDASFPDTARRHRQRAETIRITLDQLAAWYTPLDVLGAPSEQFIGESSDFEQTVATTILHGSGLQQAAALTPCPVRCPRCPHERESETDAAGAAGDRA